MSEQNIRMLVVDDEPDIREIITLFLGFQYQGDFFEAENGADAIEKIEKNSPFHLIVSDFNMPKANGLILYQYIKDRSVNLPFILVTSDQLEDHPEFMNQDLTGYVQKPFDEKSFLSQVASVLDENRFQLNTNHEFIPISIFTLERIKKITCPIFIRLNNEKLIKVLNEGSHFSAEELARFLKKGQKYLYVAKSDYLTLTKDFKSNVFSDMVFTSLERKIEDQLTLSASVQELLNSTIKTFGWSDDITDLAQKNIQLAQAAIKSDSELDSVFKWIQDDEREHSVLHSSLMVYFTSALCTKAKPEHKRASEILSLASFFHDVTLNEHQIKNEVNFVKALHAGSKLNRDDLEAIRIHAQQAKEIVKNWKHCPEELLTVIEQHHELPDGSGFPKGLKGRELNDLSIIFQVAQFLVENLLKLKNKESLVKELQQLEAFSEDPVAMRYKNAALEILSH